MLLVHSDMAGTIEPADAIRLADRLVELLIPSQWRAVTKNFIEACRLAGSRNEPLRFDYDQFATIARLIADFQREKFAAVAGPRKTNWTGHRSAIH